MFLDDEKKHLQSLADEMRVLAEPTNATQAFHQSTGLFLPGFSALPAVTILAKDTWKLRGEPEVEDWNTGDLISLKDETTEGGASSAHREFFTPIGRVEIPLVDITDQLTEDPYGASFTLKPKINWVDTELQFSFLPWSSSAPEFESSSSLVRELSATLRDCPIALEVTAEIEGERLELVPEWGVAPSRLNSAVEGMRFPVNHAWQLVDPFIFRLKLHETSFFINGGPRLLQQPITLHFSCERADLSDLIKDSGLAGLSPTGISIFPNAIPVMNVDLKAWPMGDEFSDFVGDTGMKPLGSAGVFPFRRAGSGGKNVTRSRHAPVFSATISKEGNALTGYSLSGVENAAHDHQYLLWMTKGSALNGKVFSYEKVSVRQPMERDSRLLLKAKSIVPVFGGEECTLPKNNDISNNFMLNVLASPQLFAHRDELKFIVENILQKLGYDGVEVDGPHIVLAVVDGMRQRQIFILLRNTPGKRILDHHLRAMQLFLDQRIPLGSVLRLEVVDK
jgi:hypothetical protein